MTVSGGPWSRARRSLCAGCSLTAEFRFEICSRSAAAAFELDIAEPDDSQELWRQFVDGLQEEASRPCHTAPVVVPGLRG